MPRKKQSISGKGMDPVPRGEEGGRVGGRTANTHRVLGVVVMVDANDLAGRPALTRVMNTLAFVLVDLVCKKTALRRSLNADT